MSDPLPAKQTPEATRLLIGDFAFKFAEIRSESEQAIAQLDAVVIRRSLDGDVNSVAVIMKHVGGNLRSRFTSFLTEDGERRVEVNDEGQRAHTIFRRMKVAGGYSLLEAELKTGRTHQIRVHLAAVKHPIAGDTKYGNAELNRTLKHQGLKRMFLHSARLEIRHPLTGAELKIEAPLPADLQGFLDTL